MSLSEAQFHDLIDDLQNAIEDAFDDSDLDVDLGNSGGVLTVRLENGSQLIFSRQAPLLQLWIAARSGGYHLDCKDGSWLCDSTGEDLPTLLVRVSAEQGAEGVDFSAL